MLQTLKCYRFVFIFNETKKKTCIVSWWSDSSEIFLLINDNIALELYNVIVVIILLLCE